MTIQSLRETLQNETSRLHSTIMRLAQINGDSAIILSYNDLLIVVMLAVKMTDLYANDNDTIDLIDVNRAIAALHRVNDPTASDIAEMIDRWYYDSLIEFRIRAT